MSRYNKFLTGVSLVLGMLVTSSVGSIAWAVPWPEECNINFSDPSSISHIFQEARSTFAVPTKWQLPFDKTCDDVNVPGCYVYVQQCAFLKTVSVVPVNFSHYHLSFTDPTIGGCFVNDGLGRVINGVCVAPNWVTEPRVLQPHTETIYTKVSAADISSPINFDVTFMEVGGTESVDLFYQKTDGNWWIWHNLPPGAHNLTSLTTNIKLLCIRGSTKDVSKPTIVSFRVRVSVLPSFSGFWPGARKDSGMGRNLVDTNPFGRRRVLLLLSD